MFHIFHKWEVYSGTETALGTGKLRRCSKCGRIEEERFYGDLMNGWIWEKVK